MLVWSSSASPVSERVFGAGADHGDVLAKGVQAYDEYGRGDFCRNKNGAEKGGPTLSKLGSNSTAQLHPKDRRGEAGGDAAGERDDEAHPHHGLEKADQEPQHLLLPPGCHLVPGLIQRGIEMPAIIRLISIRSDAGLGMAMFSLGLFMALQPRIIACGNTLAAIAMAVRFLMGPAVMAAASIAVGLRGVLLHIAIVQAALPQGIVPFVFAKEYNVHPDILSTAVIFGMLIALPITLVYYILLGL
ncbi:hypothetical protein ACP70R_021585 [Stipagrostis hirtigluma subsp. patula]